MKTLQEAIDKLNGKGGAGASLHKHLGRVGINRWADVTRTALYELRDELNDSVRPATAKTICANFKAILNRYKDELELPTDYAKILSVKATKPMKTFLNEGDLAKLENAPVHTVRQQFVKNVFLICAYTGLRVSDAMNLTRENIDGNVLRFTAIKTKKSGCIPLKPSLIPRIEWVADHQDCRVTRAGYNSAIRLMCMKAGIDEEVVVFKGGKEQKGPKWKFVSSHTARISTASCLYRAGVPIGDICTLLQHSGSSMTERYVVRDKVELSQKAMRFFT